MKKLLLYISLFAFTNSLLALQEEQFCVINKPDVQFHLPRFTSQTFIYPRPIFNNVAARQSIWHRFYALRQAQGERGEKACSGALQIIGLYQQTIDSNKVIDYFTFDNKKNLTVRGDNFACDRDIRAEWIGINDPDFFGEFSLNPEQKQAGGLIDYMQDISAYCDNSFFDGWWIGITVPIIVVKNDIGICQSQSTPLILSDSEGIVSKDQECPQDIINAFDQFDWKYARLSPCELRDVGLGNIYLRLGTSYLSQDCNEVGYYTSFILPGDRKQNAKYIFDAFTGNNRHFGIGIGVNLSFRIFDHHEKVCLALFLNIENELYFNNTQMRTFDLKDKPWSRYLLFNSKDGKRNIPGVNILTREVKVKPFNVFDLSTGLRWQTGCFEGEFGYNAWGHGNERIRLQECFPSNYGIAGQGTLTLGCPTCEVGATASCSTISEQGPNDTDNNGSGIFVPITKFDLDFSSVMSREVITHKVHGALGWVYHGQKSDYFFGVGALWEIPENNAAFEQYGAWAKLGGTF